jgi:hypothetical protein
MVVHKLDDTWLVVCAPELASRVKRFDDLHRVPLLRDDQPDVAAFRAWLADEIAISLVTGGGDRRKSPARRPT